MTISPYSDPIPSSHFIPSSHPQPPLVAATAVLRRRVHTFALIQSYKRLGNELLEMKKTEQGKLEIQN